MLTFWHWSESKQLGLYRVKSLRIWSFPGLCFPAFWAEYGKLLCKFPNSIRIRKNKDQKNFKYKHFSRSVISVTIIQLQFISRAIFVQ